MTENTDSAAESRSAPEPARSAAKSASPGGPIQPTGAVDGAALAASAGPVDGAESPDPSRAQTPAATQAAARAAEPEPDTASAQAVLKEAVPEQAGPEEAPPEQTETEETADTAEPADPAAPENSENPEDLQNPENPENPEDLQNPEELEDPAELENPDEPTELIAMAEPLELAEPVEGLRPRRRTHGVLVACAFVVAAVVIVGGAIAIVGSLTHGFKKPVVIHYEKSAIFSLKTGECINPNGQQAATIISCNAPHDAEVFATFSLAGSKWPGTTAVSAAASSGCSTRLTGYLNPQLAISLASTYIYPDQVAWQAGTRTVICEARATKGQLTGSIRGASATVG